MWILKDLFQCFRKRKKTDENHQEWVSWQDPIPKAGGSWEPPSPARLLGPPPGALQGREIPHGRYIVGRGIWAKAESSKGLGFFCQEGKPGHKWIRRPV